MTKPDDADPIVPDSLVQEQKELADKIAIMIRDWEVDGRYGDTPWDVASAIVRHLLSP